MIVAKGYGRRIREMIADRASQIVRTSTSTKRYTDTRFAEDVGIAERGKPYPASTLGEWLVERNEPRLGTLLAMEVALERPGAAVYIAFGCWLPEGTATPGAVRSTEPAREPLPRPKTARVKPAAGSAGRPKKRKRA